MITISEHIGFRVLQDIKCTIEGLNQLNFEKKIWIFQNKNITFAVVREKEKDWTIHHMDTQSFFII